MVFLKDSGDASGGNFAGESVPGIIAGFNQLDVEAHNGEGAGELDPEHAGADDDDAASAARMGSAFLACLLGGVLQAFGIGEGAEIEKIWHFRAGYVQRGGRAADGEQQTIEGDSFAVVEGDMAAGGIEVGDSPAGAKLDAVVDEPFAGESEEPFASELAAEELLAEGGAIVGAIDFLADEEEIAFAIEFPDRLSRLAAGDTTADEKVFYV
jgi:hypothetical protein